VSHDARADAGELFLDLQATIDDLDWLADRASALGDPRLAQHIKLAEEAAFTAAGYLDAKLELDNGND
jgi:hypothetical protein